MAKVYVIARIHASPGKENQVRELLRTMLAPTHAEPGEKVYELYQSDSPTRFYFYEIWESQAAFDFHASTVHFNALGASLEGLLIEPAEMNFLTPVM